jgi:hypothetical protein
MNECIQEWTGKLSNQDAGWVIRRDAAEKLSQIAEESIMLLKSHRDDSDRDVQKEVSDALLRIKSLAENTEASEINHKPSLEKLVKALKKPGSRDVNAVSDGFDITVSLNDGRTQTVNVSPGKSQSGNDLVHVTSICGEAIEKVHAWALKSNVQFSHCALATKTIDSKSMLVMVKSFLAEEVSFRQLKASVKEIAYYGDWVESKLDKEDLY